MGSQATGEGVNSRVTKMAKGVDTEGNSEVKEKSTETTEAEHEDRYWEKLETQSERRTRILSLYIVHMGMLVFSLGYSIVLTGVLPYLRRLTSLDSEALLDLFGWMVAINPIGQMVFSPFFGWLSNKLKSIQLICLGTCALYIVGNMLYACLSVFPDTNEGSYRWGMMLFARLLVGISTANQAPIRAYIAGATFKHERNMHISIMSLAQTIGFMIGPAIQSALTPIGCSDNYEPGSLKFDMYTISGFVSAAVGLISLVLFLPGIFKESYVAQLEAAHMAEESDGHHAHNIADVKPDAVAILACIFCFFVFLFNFILLETIGTPLCMHQLGWDENTSVRNLGVMMAIGAVVSLFCFASIAPITSRVDERLVYLVLGLVPMIAGRVAMIPMGSDHPPLKPSEDDFMGPIFRNNDCSGDGGEGGCDLEWCKDTPAVTLVQFYLGYAISAISFPYCMAICQAMFSKIIGPRPQGLWMGVLTAAGSFARILGPIFVSYIYERFGTYWTFGLCAASLGLATIVTLLTYKRLIPIEERIEKMDKEADGLTSTDKLEVTSL